MTAPPQRPRLRRGLAWLLGLALFAVSAFAAWVWLEPVLRGQARQILERELADLLRGEVHIDRVESLDFGGIVVTGVTVRDARKRPVLRASALELDMDLYALVDARLHFTRGTLRDASIHAIPSEQAVITLFDAFTPAATAAPDDDAEPSSFRVLFENIHIERAALYGDVPGLSGLRARALDVRGHIRIGPAFEAEVTRVSGKLLAPFALPLELVHATSHVTTEPVVIRANARLALNEDKLRAALVYKAPANQPDELNMTVMVEPASSELLRAFQLSIGESLLTPLTGTIQLQGPLDDLAFGAALRSEAGPLVVRGRFPTRGDGKVQVQTDGLELARLLAYFPPISLRTTVDAVVPEEGPITIAARAPWLQVFGLEIANVELAGSYAAGRLDIARLLASYAGGRFVLNGWVDENADARLRLRSHVPDAGRDALVRSLGVRVGLRTDAVLEKRGALLSFEGKIGFDDFQHESLSFESLDLDGSVRAEDDFSRPRVRLRGRGARVLFEGYGVEGVEFALRGDRGRYATDFAMQDAGGRKLTGHVELEQLGEAYRIVAQPFELSVGGRDPWRAQADIVLEPDGIDFRKLLLANGAQRLDLSGRYSYSKAYRLDATLQSFDLGGLRELSGIDMADLDGVVDGTLALTGVPNHPRIDVQGSLRHGVFLGMTDLTVLLSLVFVEGRFDVDSEVVLPDGSRLAVYAGGEPGPGETWTTQIGSGNYQFGLDFERVPFAVSEPWLAWLGIKPPPGTISATLRGAGTFAAPTLELATQVHAIELPDFPPLDMQLNAAHDGTTFALRKFGVSDGLGEIVAVEGSIDARFDEVMDVASLRASLATRAHRLAIRWPERRLDQLPGRVRADLPVITAGTILLEQTPDGPAAQLEVRASWPEGKEGLGACTTLRRPELVLEANARGQETRGTLSMRLDQENLAQGELRAETPVTAWLTGAQPIVLPRTAATLNVVTDTVEEIPLICEYMAGPLRLELSANDLFADPPDVRFQLQSAALQLVPHASQAGRLGNLRTARAAGRPFSFAAHGGLEGELVRFSAAIDQGNGARMEANGTIPRAALRSGERPAQLEPGRANVRFASFELAPLLLALPVGARISGIVDGTSQVTYDVQRDALTFAGALALTRGRLVIAPLGQELSDVRATLRMQGNWIRIEELQAHDFDGKLRAEGNVIFDSSRSLRTDLALRLSDFPVRREGAQVSALTGRLDLRAEVNGERTRSELEVLDLRINLPNDLGQSVQDLAQHPDIVVAGEERAPPPEHPYLFELRLLATEHPFRVMRTGLNAEVSADVLVRYQDPRLTLQGNAELQRGNFEMYGKRFELQESRMAFDGSDQLDPLVSLYAVHRVGGDEIGVRVEGRLSAPTVTFTHSDPAVTDTGEIIARLLGARSDDAAQQGQDATGAAAGFLAGATAGLLTEEVRKEFGGAIPVLSIESGSQDMRGTRIRAGVQLDQLIEKRLGPLRHVVRGAYVEGFVAPGADPDAVGTTTAPQSRGGGLLELRFPADMVGTVEYRPIQNWRLDVAWEP